MVCKHYTGSKTPRKEDRPTDALIVKTYVISASTSWFVVPVGDVLTKADESKIR
jgi:hypothetical protein